MRKWLWHGLGLGAVLFAALWSWEAVKGPRGAGDGPVGTGVPHRMEPASGRPQAEPQARAHSQPANSNARAIAGAGATPAAWFDGFRTRDPYPVFAALRAAHSPGSFASASKLIEPCVKAYMYFEEIESKLVNSPMTEQTVTRLQARDEIQLRCNRFGFPHREAQMLMFVPEPGDAPGLRYREASQVLALGEQADRMSWARKELIAQGRGDLLLNMRVPEVAWRDPRMRAGGPVAQAARAWAHDQYTQMSGDATDDLRVIAACFQWGACSRQYIDPLAKLTPDQRQLAIELGTSLLSAIHSRDARALLH